MVSFLRDCDGENRGVKRPIQSTPLQLQADRTDGRSRERMG